MSCMTMGTCPRHQKVEKKTRRREVRVTSDLITPPSLYVHFILLRPTVTNLRNHGFIICLREGVQGINLHRSSLNK